MAASQSGITNVIIQPYNDPVNGIIGLATRDRGFQFSAMMQFNIARKRTVFLILFRNVDDPSSCDV